MCSPWIGSSITCRIKTPGLSGIACIEQFVWRIRPQEKIFALLEMWEIARPYNACLDEFQRTLKYIEDTITALKEMEKESRPVERAGDYIYQVRRYPLGICLCNKMDISMNCVNRARILNLC